MPSGNKQGTMVLACDSALDSGPGLASNLAGREPGLRAASNAARPAACLRAELPILRNEHFEAFGVRSDHI